MFVPGLSVYHLLRRVLIVWSTEVVGLWLLARVLPGLHVEGWRAAVLGVASIGLLNALVRPALLLLTLPFTVVTYGFLTLVLNATILLLAAQIVPGFRISNPAAALAAAIGLAAINTAFASVIALNHEDSFYRNMVKRIAKRFGTSSDTGNSPGMIIIELDGLALPVLRQAMRDGYVPTLTRLVSSGTHKLLEWDCGLPSQTSSSQGGILFGNNFDIPAFRWYEKDRSYLMVSNHPRDTAIIEERLSNGRGLLADGGVSIGNMLSGDASRRAITMSTFFSHGFVPRHNRMFFNYFLNPYNFTRALVLMMWEVGVELWEAARQRFRGSGPRVSRGGSYPLVRAVSAVLLREMSVYLLTSEMFSGVTSSYMSLVGYDVVAHHSGPYRRDALRLCHDLDRRLATLMRAAEDCPRPYHFVIVSDHGQTPSVPFRQIYNTTLEELVRSVVKGGADVHAPSTPDEGWGHVNALLTEAIGHERLAGRAARRILRHRTKDGAVDFGDRGAKREDGAAEVVVCVSGNLGLIYFTEQSGRASFEWIASQHPELIKGLVAHDGIGFVMVHSEDHGPIAIGRSGINYLGEGRVEGDNPLIGYGANAEKHLKRLDTFPHSGDIVVNGRYDANTETLVTFEDQVGSHGGLGGAQGQPFIMYPSEWTVGSSQIQSPLDLFEVLSRWRDSLGTARPQEHDNASNS